MTIPDIVCDECDPDQIILDPSIRTRSMSKRALILEAASEKHKKAHYPHNPYCEICDRSHMRQASVNVKKERNDDELPPLTGKLQRLSADHMYMQRSSDGGETEYVGFGVRDEYSGM